MGPTPAEALAAVADIGGFFAVRTSAEPPVHAVSLASLQAGGSALDRSIVDVARRLGTSERRVAASIFFQGLAARLWSPVVAGELLFDTRVGFTPASTWWHPTDGCSADPASLGHGSVDEVWPDLLAPLAARIRSLVGLSSRILLGNAASALAGSLSVLTREHPEVADAAVGLLRRHLAVGSPLAGAGVMSDENRFTRRSCCLYYRVPGGGLCGDCVLARS